MNVSKIISSTEASPFGKHSQSRSLLLPKNAEGDAFINNLNQYLKNHSTLWLHSMCSVYFMMFYRQTLLVRTSLGT